MRTCQDCRQALPVADFAPCRGARARANGWRERRCRPCAAVVRRDQYMETGKAREFAWRYGITLAERDEMLEAQGGKCAICSRTEHAGHDWCVDHDHSCCDTRSRSCGKCIRGILCHPCNSALGLFRDNEATLRSAINYLRSANVSRMQPF